MGRGDGLGRPIVLLVEEELCSSQTLERKYLFQEALCHMWASIHGRTGPTTASAIRIVTRL